MKTHRLKEYDSGAYVYQDNTGQLIVVKVYSPAGQLVDKIRTDSRAIAREYFSAFSKIAKNWSA
jgi:hypothetical protein